MVFRNYYWMLLFLSSWEVVFSQTQPISISGKITNNKGTGNIYQAIVLNQRTSEGMLANSGGSFTLQALKSDTILVNAPGFIVKKICFNDSIFRTNYRVNIRLDSLHYELKEVSVYPSRNLKEIKEEEKTLGVIPNTNLTKVCDTSAILLQLLTLHLDIDGLYEKWSAKEREKRKAAKLEDIELKNSILKELFIFYRKNNILNIEDCEFDKFIDYCNFTAGFVRNATDYELVTAIKEKHTLFEKKDSYVSSGLK